MGSFEDYQKALQEKKEEKFVEKQKEIDGEKEKKVIKCTTIKLKMNTKKEIDKLKLYENESYDETIRRMIKKNVTIQK